MCQSCFNILKCGIIELKYCGIRVGQTRTKRANFPLGLAPQKRPPQVIKIWLKCGESNVFLRLVGAFFGEPTQVENRQPSVVISVRLSRHCPKKMGIHPGKKGHTWGFSLLGYTMYGRFFDSLPLFGDQL